MRNYSYIYLAKVFCPAEIGEKQDPATALDIFDDRSYFIDNGLIEQVQIYAGQYIDSLVR